MPSKTGMPFWDACQGAKRRDWLLRTGRVKKHQPIHEVPIRWGMPFWDVVRDLHAQGLTRNKAAKALGYKDYGSFKYVLVNNPELDPWEPWNVAHRYLVETGETFGAACRRLMREGVQVREAMLLLGYTPGGWVQFMAALKARGVEDKFLRRGDPRIPLAPRTVRAKELAAGAPHKPRGCKSEGGRRSGPSGLPHPWRYRAKA